MSTKGKRGKDKGSSIDNDTRTFIASMEATAKKILTKHHKNRMADAARAKAEKRAKERAEKAAIRAWAETGAPRTAMGEGDVFTMAPNSSLFGMTSAFDSVPRNGFDDSYASTYSSGGLPSPIVAMEGPAPHVGLYGPDSHARKRDRGPGMGGSIGRSGLMDTASGTMYGTSEMPLPASIQPGKMEETPYPFHMEGESLPSSVMGAIHRQAKSLRGAAGVSSSTIGLGSDPNAVAAAVAAKLKGNQSEASLPPLSSTAPALQPSNSVPGREKRQFSPVKDRANSVSLPKVPPQHRSLKRTMAGMEKLASSPLALVRSKAGKAAPPVTTTGLLKAGKGRPDFKVSHANSTVNVSDLHLSVPGATARSSSHTHTSKYTSETSATSKSNTLVAGLTSGAVSTAMKAGMKEENEAGNARSSMERRICEACWSQPTDMLTKDAAGFNGDIRSLAKDALQMLEKQGPTSWNSVDIRQKYRDEEVRLLAHAASMRAAEEAAELEREEGVIVPVVVVPPHSMHALFNELVQRENRASSKRSRDRVALKRFHSNVRTVWLSGATPHSAPLPWQNLPYSGSASSFEGADGGVPGMATATFRSFGGLSGSVAMLPPPPLPGQRRGLRDRRDESAVQSGYHLIQSVSLSRAMAGAYVTPLPEDAGSTKSSELWADDVPDVDVSGDWVYWNWFGTPGLHPTEMESAAPWLKWFGAAGDPTTGAKPSEGTGWTGYGLQAKARKRLVDVSGEERGVTRTQRLGEYLPKIPASATFEQLSIVPWFVGAAFVVKGRLPGMGTEHQDPVPAIVRVYKEMELFRVPADDSPLGADAGPGVSTMCGNCLGVVVQVFAGPEVETPGALRFPTAGQVASGQTVGSWIYADPKNRGSLALFEENVSGASIESEVRIPLGRFLEEAQTWSGIRDLLHVRAQEVKTQSGALDLGKIRTLRREARALAAAMDGEEKEEGSELDQQDLEGGLEEEKRQNGLRSTFRVFKDQFVKPFDFLRQDGESQSPRSGGQWLGSEVKAQVAKEQQRWIDARQATLDQRRIPQLPWLEAKGEVEEWEDVPDEQQEEADTQPKRFEEDAPLPFSAEVGLYGSPPPSVYDSSKPQLAWEAVQPLQPPAGVVEGLLSSINLVVTGIGRPYPPRGSLARVSVVSVEGEPDDTRVTSGRVVGYVVPVTARGVIRDGRRLVGEEKAQELGIEADDWVDAQAAAAHWHSSGKQSTDAAATVSSTGFLTEEELRQWEQTSGRSRDDWTVGHRVTEFYVNDAYRWGGEVVRAAVAGVVDGRQSSDMNWLNNEPRMVGPWRQWWRYMDWSRKLDFIRRVSHSLGLATDEGEASAGGQGSSRPSASEEGLLRAVETMDQWVFEGAEGSPEHQGGWPTEAKMGNDVHIPSSLSPRRPDEGEEGEEKEGDTDAGSELALFKDNASLAVTAVAAAKQALMDAGLNPMPSRALVNHPLSYFAPQPLPYAIPPEVPLQRADGSFATMPWVPVHMRDAARGAFPQGRLPDVVLATGEGGTWGAVPGVTALGRMDIVAGIFVKDSGVSTTEGVVARVIGYSALPRTVGALHAEEFEVGSKSMRKKTRLVAKTLTPEPRREFWPRFPITLTVSPSRCSSLFHELDSRKPFRITLVTDAAVPVYDCTAAVEGHIRLIGDALEPGSGRRLWEVVHVPQPNPRIKASSYGIRQEAAIGSAATLWGERFTWHSDFLYKSGFTHSAKDFLYVLANPLDVGPNVPNTYILRMRYETVRELESSSLEEWRLDERQRQAQKEIREQEEAAARGAEALKQRREDRMRQRALLAAQWREKHLRKAARMRGKASTLSISKEQWRAKRLRPGARVMARFGPWERWVIFAAESGNASDGDDVSKEKYEEVWYYNPEQDISSYDAPKDWPETQWIEEARKSTTAQRRSDLNTLGTSSLRTPGPGLHETSVAAASAVTSDAAAFGNASTLISSTGDPGAREAASILAGPRLDPETGIILGIGEPDAEREVDPDTDIYRFASTKRAAFHTLLVEAYSRALRRWFIETAVRGSLTRPKRNKSNYASAAAAAAASEGIFKDVSTSALLEGERKELEHIDDIWRQSPPKEVVLQALEDDVIPPVPGMETAAAGNDGSNLASASGVVVRRHVLTQRISKELQRKAERRWERQMTGQALEDVDKDPEMQSLKSLLWELQEEAEDADTSGQTALERDLAALHTNWRRTGKFDLRIAFRALDRDRDGYISVRDFGLATGGDSLLGEVSAADALATYTPENAEATAALMTGVLPYLVQILEEITPPQLRNDVGKYFPSVQRQDLMRASLQPPPVSQQGVIEDESKNDSQSIIPGKKKKNTVLWANDPRQYSFVESSMFGAADPTPYEERQEVTDAVVRGKGAGARVLANLKSQVEDERNRKGHHDDDGTPPQSARSEEEAVDTVGPVTSELLDKLADLITPAVRYDVFKRMKRPRLPQLQRDKYPNRVSFEEFLAFVSGDSGGCDWFGVPLDRFVCRSARPLPFNFTAERQELVHGIGQWLGPVDEASGEVYYVNSISGMSVWEKPSELITAESALRNLCVTLVEKEMREEKREYARILSMQRHITLVRLQGRAKQLVHRFRAHLEAMRTHAHRERSRMVRALKNSRRRANGEKELSDLEEDEEGEDEEFESDMEGEEKVGEGPHGLDPFSSALKTVLGSLKTGGEADATALSRLAESLGSHPALVTSLAKRLGLPTPRSVGDADEKDYGGDGLMGSTMTSMMSNSLTLSDTGIPMTSTMNPKALGHAAGGGGGMGAATGTRSVTGTWRGRGLEHGVSYDHRKPQPGWSGTYGSANVPQLPEAEGDPDVRLAQRRPAAVQQHRTLPGVGWRTLRPPKSVVGLRERALEPRTMDARLCVGLNSPNIPQLVGLVDPAQVTSYVPDLEFFRPQTHLVKNITRDSEQLEAAARMEAILGADGGGPVAAGFAKEEKEEKEKEEEKKREATVQAFLAVQSNKYEQLEEILFEGIVPVDAKDENGNTLLLVAAQNGNKRISKLLLRKGAKINAQNLRGNTVLHYTRAYKFSELFEYFLSKGADDSITNGDGLTCYEGLEAAEVDNL